MSRMLDAIRQIEARSAAPPIPTQVCNPMLRDVPVATGSEPNLELYGNQPTSAIAGWPECPIAADAPASNAAAEDPIPGPARADHQRFAEQIRKQLPLGAAATLGFVHLGRERSLIYLLAALARLLRPRPLDEVLLIDADYSASAQAHRAVVQPRPGLAGVLQGKSTWAELILPTALAGVSWLPAGSASPQTTFDATSVTELWGELRARFPLVLVDAGPAASALATGLAASCDALYLLFDAKQTPRREIRRVVDRLRQAGARLAGCALVTGQS
jgi:Mrp family chromosome partitioning ATPase